MYFIEKIYILPILKTLQIYRPGIWEWGGGEQDVIRREEGGA